MTIRPLAALVLLAATPVFAVADDESAAPKLPGHQLAWHDEFDADGPPSPDNWTYERGFVRNEELQWYQPENAFCEDGLLVIEGRRERVPNPRYEPGARDWRRNREFAEYTSACVISRGRREWTHGKLLVRARIDAQPGLWPAIWTLGTKRGWPGCGEIDVMEYYQDTILANAFWQARRRKGEDVVKVPLEKFGDGWAEKFHVWQLDWTPERLQILIDDKLVNEVSLAEAVNGDGTQPFQEPHYLLLNLAIGGQAGGDPSQVEFPSRFEIDYVRVYQRTDE